MTQYQNLLEQIKEPTPDYYLLLLTNSKHIVKEVKFRNQGVVAKELNISQSKLSNILPLLDAYVNINS